MEKIKNYFNRYPKSDEVFEVEGVLFHKRGAAESYSKGKIQRYTREQAFAKQPDADNEPAPESETGNPVDAVPENTLETVNTVSAVPEKVSEKGKKVEKPKSSKKQSK